MNDILYNPLLLLFCLLALSFRTTSSSYPGGFLSRDGSLGLAIALWSLVIAGLVPVFFLDAQIGNRYLLILHSGSALVWFAIFAVFASVLMPPLPASVTGSASLAALIASPDLLRFDLLFGGLLRFEAPHLSLLLVILPILAILSRLRPVIEPPLPFALWTLFFGLIPASLLLFRNQRSWPSVPAILGGSFGYLLLQQLSNASAVAGSAGALGGLLLVEWVQRQKEQHP
ncbi:MAG TPA: hypothetical protein PKO06_10630 [Candidatus Ozemobacteraceae bacterium]|nr:hypothetical protein [Candidatus Ozemobacteraceae bacterium]